MDDQITGIGNVCNVNISLRYGESVSANGINMTTTNRRHKARGNNDVRHLPSKRSFLFKAPLMTKQRPCKIEDQKIPMPICGIKRIMKGRKFADEVQIDVKPETHVSVKVSP